MFAELRMPEDPSPQSGIDVGSLKLALRGSGPAGHRASIRRDGEHREVDLTELSPSFAGELHDLQYNLRKLAQAGVSESQVLVLRGSHAPRPTLSRRRGRRRVSSPMG